MYACMHDMYTSTCTNEQKMYTCANMSADTYLFVFLLPSLSTLSMYLYKVIIHKSRGELSLVEQNTIENVSTACFKFIINFVRVFFFQFHSVQLFSADATIFFKKKMFFCL